MFMYIYTTQYIPANVHVLACNVTLVLLRFDLEDVNVLKVWAFWQIFTALCDLGGNLSQLDQNTRLQTAGVMWKVALIVELKRLTTNYEEEKAAVTNDQHKPGVWGRRPR